MVQKRKKHSKNSRLNISCPKSLRGSEWASKWVNAAECASKVSNVDQANKWAVRANEQTDKQVTQNLHLDSWLFWAIVHFEKKSIKKQVYSSLFSFIPACCWRFCRFRQVHFRHCCFRRDSWRPDSAALVEAESRTNSSRDHHSVTPAREGEKMVSW